MKHIHSPRFARKTPTQTLSCLIAICMFLASIFQPGLKAAGPAPLLTMPDVIAIIVELAAGTALDMWLDQNGDPRNDRSEAMAVGAYYTGANYWLSADYNHCDTIDSHPYQVKQSASRGNERDTDPNGSPIDQLDMRANLKGWTKTFVVKNLLGIPSFPYLWTASGTGQSISDTDAQEVFSASIHNPSLSLGCKLADVKERWRVGYFVVSSDWSATTATLHPKLKEKGYYPAEISYKKKKITYWGGKVIDQSNVIDDRKKILLRADSPSARYFKLCGENERLLERPIVYGGVSRWVEKEKNIHDCAFPDQPILHLFPVEACQWIDRLVVKERRAKLPSELD